MGLEADGEDRPKRRGVTAPLPAATRGVAGKDAAAPRAAPAPGHGVAAGASPGTGPGDADGLGPGPGPGPSGPNTNPSSGPDHDAGPAARGWAIYQPEWQIGQRRGQPMRPRQLCMQADGATLAESLRAPRGEEGKAAHECTGRARQADCATAPRGPKSRRWSTWRTLRHAGLRMADQARRPSTCCHATRRRAGQSTCWNIQEEGYRARTRAYRQRRRRKQR